MTSDCDSLDNIEFWSKFQKLLPQRVSKEHKGIEEKKKQLSFVHRLPGVLQGRVRLPRVLSGVVVKKDLI